MFNLLKRRIILAAGGTGGHVFPAQALAEVLVPKGWRVFLITDNRGNGFANEFPEQVEKLVLNMSNPSGAGKINFILSFWFLIKSLITVLQFCILVKPSIIVGFGGYPSLTSMIIAKVLRKSSAIHEQNATLGRVNQMFQNQVDLLVFGLRPKNRQKRKVKSLVLGNPIRKAILQVNPDEYFKLPTSSFVIFVVGGSQGANFVSSIACDAIIGLPENIRKKVKVLHQCRHESISEIKSKYDAHNIKSETKSFFSDISFCFNRANLVIGRSGASSVAELCFFGRPSILIPLPTAVGNHQFLNAAGMQEIGACVILNEKHLNPEDLRKKIRYILENSRAANRMASSAKKLSKPHAALDFASELENLILREMK